MKMPATLVKQSLSSHSWLGLAVSVLMYIVCLTGTLCVVYPELQRWEQASRPDLLNYDVAAVERVVNSTVANENLRTDHLYLYLPTEDAPRLSLANERQEWFIDSDGTLGEAVSHPWTEFLINMHVYLTVPGTAGLILVSMLGAMLCALIVSGILAHPRIFRDAFKLRLGKGTRLEQVDIHNRLSVWGTPFYLLIAITGAYFGLVIPMLGAVSAVTGKDPVEIQASVFGEEPEVYQEGELQLVAAFNSMTDIDPHAIPFRVVLHDVGKPKQFIEIMASHPQRMIYSETYRFDAAGSYLGKVGFSDGEPGRQIVYSMYFLHFGHFAGYVSKAIYFLLGLALTVVSVTGINIWLRKRTHRDAFNELWQGVVWGVPLALLIAMITRFVAGFVSVPLFWLNLVAIMAYCLSTRDEFLCGKHLQLANAVGVATVLTLHIVHFGLDGFTGGALIINLGLFAYLLTLLVMLKPSLGKLLRISPIAAN